LLNLGLKIKLNNLAKNSNLKHPFFDKLFFTKIREIFGGKVRMCFTGSAPLSKEVLNFFKIALSCPFFEAYG
jgi:long-chain acyl-CoA synthetase